jgi:uncharacterized protein with HEPN domain
MRRDDELPNDILDALDWISGAVSRVTEAEFLADETLRYAVAQKLTVVGEAVTRLSAELKAHHPTVPWSDIVALRNILVHEYFGIHWPLVWYTARNDAPILRAQVANILGTGDTE